MIILCRILLRLLVDITVYVYHGYILYIRTDTEIYAYIDKGLRAKHNNILQYVRTEDCIRVYDVLYITTSRETRYIQTMMNRRVAVASKQTVRRHIIELSFFPAASHLAVLDKSERHLGLAQRLVG